VGEGPHASPTPSKPRTTGQMLWNAGDAPRGLHVLLEGEVRVVRIVGGRQHVVHTEGPGGTQTEVAEELGTVREVLVRGLRELRDARVIAPAGRGRFRVLDAARLRRLAGAS